eukprot:933267-Rhodomonas_salina.1
MPPSRTSEAAELSLLQRKEGILSWVKGLKGVGGVEYDVHYGSEDVFGELEAVSMRMNELQPERGGQRENHRSRRKIGGGTSIRTAAARLCRPVRGIASQRV